MKKNTSGWVWRPAGTIFFMVVFCLWILFCSAVLGILATLEVGVKVGLINSAITASSALGVLIVFGCVCFIAGMLCDVGNESVRVFDRIMSRIK